MSSHSLIPSNASQSEEEYLEMLAELFRRNGWKVKANPLFGRRKADLQVSRGSYRYVVELKVSSEGRRDRLVPMLAQAILQAKAIAQASPKPIAPLAVIAAPIVSPSLAAGLKHFLAENASDAAAGMFDREGFRSFIGPGLENLNVSPPICGRRRHHPSTESSYLFSDLNQWMLKVLLAPNLSEKLLRAPRGEYRNASQLAQAAQVSVMSAFRLVRQLRQEGFLDSESEVLRLVRREELMRRWQAAHLRSVPELPLRWIIPAKWKDHRLSAALSQYVAHPDKNNKAKQRACLGLFAAAEHLGFGFVRGVPPHFYLENLDREVLRSLGLSSERAEQSPNVYVRVPTFRESVFRAAVLRADVPVADILQVWLDVSSHPARGEAQAEEIRRRVFTSVFESGS
ncbi:MAG: hypothetical protein ACYCOX_02770 [Acidobacteriaceae bacterium]